jgi:hypothetical protein
VSVPVIPENTTSTAAAEGASYRPRVSRETRRLLMTSLLAVLTLLALARLRFPDRPPAANPVPPILGQLTGPPTFADLASRVAELRGRLADSVVSLVMVREDGDARTPAGDERVPALRIRDDLAAAIIARRSHDDAAPLGGVAEDRGSGLTLVQIAETTRPTLPLFWSPRELDQARYLLASSTSPGEISLQPVFIGSLTPIVIPQWTTAVWALPGDTRLTSGSLLFTEDAEFVGAVAPRQDGLVVVPARTLLAAAERLAETPQKLPADPGLEVDALTPRLVMAAGADTGVVVTWVDPAGVAATMLSAGDVIQAVDDMEITSPEEWRVRVARVGLGDTLVLRVTRRGALRTVSLKMPAPGDEGTSVLGLTMRAAPRIGVEIVRVERGSAADVAGIVAGDLITAVGDTSTPTPAQVRNAFASMHGGELVILAVRRGATHRVVALQR